MRLPKYVERTGKKFRGTICIKGVRYKTEAFSDPDQAHTKAIELKILLLDPGMAVTLGEAMADILDEVKEKRTEGTLAWYESHFRAINRFIGEGTRLAEITPHVIEGFISKRLGEVTGNTVVQDLRAMHRVFARMVKKGTLKENPLKRVDYPSVTQARMDYFEPADLAGLITKVRDADPECGDLFCLMAYTGLRRSEILRLRCQDIDLRGKQIWVKGKRRNEGMPISAQLLPVLRNMVKAAGGQGPLLSDGENQWARTVRRLKRIVGKEMGGSRIMRHSFITALVRADVPLHVVKQLSRHRTLSMVMRYYHQGTEAKDALGKLPY